MTEEHTDTTPEAPRFGGALSRPCHPSRGKPGPGLAGSSPRTSPRQLRSVLAEEGGKGRREEDRNRRKALRPCFK